ncbi:hypothetical protein ISN44_As07g011240 [Arabidopsis suecica]|uniref:Uncharacterized protein n=1 Tax=Arabidopsis suecica TaxID=45249 RepID=A0A8T2BSX1_ARASU|nr:hypothetical protein ISN44_As07g011240 [Arabidopsis suecica]
MLEIRRRMLGLKESCRTRRRSEEAIDPSKPRLDELNLKLRRADVSVSRAEEEFACYRASSGKNSYSNFDKTNKLSAKRKETEEERMHLLCLYKSILKDINIMHAKHKAASVTGEALEQLKKKLGLLESEIRHSSLKVPLKASIP